MRLIITNRAYEKMRKIGKVLKIKVKTPCCSLPEVSVFKKNAIRDNEVKIPYKDLTLIFDKDFCKECKELILDYSDNKEIFTVSSLKYNKVSVL